MKIIEETPYRFRIEREGAMRMPGMVFASRSLLPEDQGDMALTQVANVATLPGIVRASYAMPDVRWGYGFPIGGVAATDVDNDGVISPGGVGFDISCGVRLLVSRELDRDGLQPWIRAIPRGVGAKGVWRLPNRSALQQVLSGGARFAVQQCVRTPQRRDPLTAAASSRLTGRSRQRLSGSATAPEPGRASETAAGIKLTRWLAAPQRVSQRLRKRPRKR